MTQPADKTYFMDQISTHISVVSARVDAMSFRERIMFMLVCGVLIITLFQLLWFDRIQHQNKQLTQQMEAATQQGQSLRDQASAIEQAHRADPNAELKARLQQIEVDIQQVTSSMTSASSGLLSPQQIPGLLRNLVASQEGLRLLRIETLPVSRVDINGNVIVDEKQAQDGSLYRHGLELEVVGNYESITHWLMAVEQVPAPMQWGFMHYRVDDKQNGPAPKAHVILRVYTLSLQEVWLSV